MKPNRAIDNDLHYLLFAHRLCESCYSNDTDTDTDTDRAPSVRSRLRGGNCRLAVVPGIAVGTSPSPTFFVCTPQRTNAGKMLYEQRIQ